MSRAPRPPLLERFGIGYFRRRSGSLPEVAAEDSVHHLNPDELRALRRVVGLAIARAALAGALSTAAAAVSELWAAPLLGPDPDLAHWRANAAFWAVVGATTVVASIFEIAFLYWDALRSVHELARVAGLDLFRAKDERAAVAAALARAALELPNSPDPVFGVNPRKEASRWRLLAASLVYKAKIGITNFLVKAVVRRILGRVMVRTAAAQILPFVAVPITALWNAAVCWKVLREARLRAMGPSFVEEVLTGTFAAVPGLSVEGKLAALRAVAAAIVRTQDLHPNLFFTLAEVHQRVGDTARGELDDPRLLLDQLPRLPAEERRLAVQLCTLAVIIDGRINASERRLLSSVQAAAGQARDLQAAETLRRAFLRGQRILPEQLRNLAPI